jgi:putative nucleotidyltransferase with HDIG domain
MNRILGSEIRVEDLSLPTIPTSAARVLRLIRDPDSDAAQIEQAVRYDPAFTGNILRLANSAYFGFSGEIGSVRQAVVHLGWKMMFHIVVATSIRSVMAKKVPGYELAPGELWRHSIAVSVASEGLAKHLKIPTPEEAFTAALLHDLGKLVTGAYVDEDLEKVEDAVAGGLSFEEAERVVLGFDHSEIGGRVLEHWAFPPELVHAVRWHHDPDRAPERGVMLDIVHVADMLCLMLGIGIGREGLGYRPATGATDRLGLRVADLESVASRTLEGTEELLRSLELA